jgi:UDP-N-acetylglucosamine 2-epimerase
MIGNSSSGLTEAPHLGLTTINIGNRQEGRVQFGNIINVSAKSKIIERKIRLALNKKKKINKNNLKKGATKKIVKIIEKLNLSNPLKKSFYDLN